MNHVCPLFGLLSVLGICVSPLASVRRVQENRQIGTVNTFPFVMMISYSITWLLYSLHIRDYYMLCTQIFVFSHGLYYLLETIPYESRRNIRISEGIIVSLVAVSALLAGVSAITFAERPQMGQYILGTWSCTLLTLFFISNLVSLKSVIQLKDSSSIDIRLSAANLIASLFWGIYGVVLLDPFIITPNAFGIVISLIPIGFRLIYPSRNLSQNDLPRADRMHQDVK